MEFFFFGVVGHEMTRRGDLLDADEYLQSDY
jgi:hypothetical protein